jgi:hypothetical protein
MRVQNIYLIAPQIRQPFPEKLSFPVIKTIANRRKKGRLDA